MWSLGAWGGETGGGADWGRGGVGSRDHARLICVLKLGREAAGGECRRSRAAGAAGARPPTRLQLGRGNQQPRNAQVVQEEGWESSRSDGSSREGKLAVRP
jgi:hypothetical protein